MPKLSRVVVGVPAAEQWKKPLQSYEQLVVKYQVNIDTISFFNQILSDQEFDIFGFLPPKFWFNSQDTVSTIVAKFIDMPQIIGAVYSDIEIEDKCFSNKYSYTKHLNYFHEGMNTFSCPIFINKKMCPNIVFRQSNNMFETFINDLAQQGTMLVHVAESLFIKHV